MVSPVKALHERGSNDLPAGDGGVVLRVSVTPRCQLRCRYCMPSEGWRPISREDAPLDDASLCRIISLLHRIRGVKRVRFTGGEPLLRRDLPDLVRRVSEVGVEELALTTNGQLLAPVAAELREAGLARVNVSLDSLDTENFRAITRGGDLSRTIDGIDAALRTGLTPVKLNTVVMRGVNDHEVADLLRFALERGCHIRFLELMPIGVAAARFDEQYVDSEETRSRLEEVFPYWEPLSWDHTETSRDFRVRDRAGRETICGFISPTSQPFCDGCRRLRIEANGTLHGCLARASAFDLRPILDARNDPEASLRLRELLARAFSFKQGARRYDGAGAMSAIGG